MPDKRKRDLDNCAKIVLDSLKYANVFLDDDQIMELHMYKLEKVKGGKCEVEILKCRKEIRELESELDG